MTARTIARGLCLAVAFALGTASTAGATTGQPEYELCFKTTKVAKKYTGRYDDNRCMVQNAGQEGKYETKQVATPHPFSTEGKAGVIYYRGPTGGIVWEVKCKRDSAKGVITGPASGDETIFFEECKASNEIAKEKAQECPQRIVANVESALVEVLPAAAPGVLLYPGFAKAFSCGSVTFGAMAGFEVAGVVNTGKGPVGAFSVDQATGEQETTEFFDFEEGETFHALLQSEATGSPPLDVGIEAALPLGASGELVVEP
jgi:hypothetical protein